MEPSSPLTPVASPLAESSPVRYQSNRRKRRRICTGSSTMDIDAGLPELIGGGKNRNTKDRPRKTHNTRSHTRSRPTPTPSSTLESIALEENNLKSEMNRLSLKLRDVEGDGNCLFRALADQLWGEQKRHAEVRYRVCDFLEENQGVMRDFVVPFMQDGEDYSSYVNRMRQLTNFGSHIEIQAAAVVYSRSIRVIMPTTSFTIPHQLPQVKVDPAEPAPPPGRTMLWLALFSEAEHYQSIRRKDDSGGPALVEDRLAIPHALDRSEAARKERGEPASYTQSQSQSQSHHSSTSSSLKLIFDSLPPGHRISTSHAQGVLDRVKGNTDEAIEILLEEISYDSEVGSDASGSDKKVERLLYRERSGSTTSTVALTPGSVESGTTESNASAGTASTKVTTPSTSTNSNSEGEKGVGRVGLRVRPKRRLRERAGRSKL